jgi:hypothetical protein
MGVLITISKGLELASTFGPVAVGLALQIRQIFRSADNGQDFQVQLSVFRNGTIEALDETDAIIADWLKTHPEHA